MLSAAFPRSAEPRPPQANRAAFLGKNGPDGEGRQADSEPHNLALCLRDWLDSDRMTESSNPCLSAIDSAQPEIFREEAELSPLQGISGSKGTGVGCEKDAYP